MAGHLIPVDTDGNVLMQAIATVRVARSEPVQGLSIRTEVGRDEHEVEATITLSHKGLRNLIVRAFSNKRGVSVDGPLKVMVRSAKHVRFIPRKRGV